MVPGKQKALSKPSLFFYCHFVTITTITTSITTTTTTTTITITVTIATIRTTNRQQSFPPQQGHLPKKIMPANLISGKQKGKEAWEWHQRLFFTRCNVPLALFHYHSGHQRPIPMPSFTTPRPISLYSLNYLSCLTDGLFIKIYSHL